jgi:hypothetical protein
MSAAAALVWGHCWCDHAYKTAAGSGDNAESLPRGCMVSVTSCNDKCHSQMLSTVHAQEWRRRLITEGGVDEIQDHNRQARYQ